ncbi:MAG: SH3 domain-containing protein [Lachnospiraceae bacterium]|nr:SH3 domain-containing protein [Lachnospiraceae bacterium]
MKNWKNVLKDKRNNMIYFGILVAALACAGIGILHPTGGRTVAAEEAVSGGDGYSLSGGDSESAEAETVSDGNGRNAGMEKEIPEESVSDGDSGNAGAEGEEASMQLIAGLPRAELAIANVNDYINVRSGPGTDSPIIGKLYDGSVAQVLDVAGENGEWFHISSGSVEGYAKAEFFLYGDAATQVLDDYVTRYALVQADRLNVREEPDLGARKLGSVNTGRRLVVLEDCGEWIKVQYTDREAGYVSAEYVILTEEFTYAKSLEEERAEREAARAAAAQAAAAQASAAQTSALISGNAGNETTYTPPEITNFDSADDLRAAIVEYAKQYLGNVYIHGGSSLANGTDCSGFTCFIYADFGYSISRTPGGQLSGGGRSIDYSEIKPGDIVCYTSNGGRSCTHVGLYIGDGQIIHSANSRKGVIISDVNYSTIMGIKNVID